MNAGCTVAVVALSLVLVAGCKREPIKMTASPRPAADGLDVSIDFRKGGEGGALPPDTTGKIDLVETDKDVVVCKSSATAASGKVSAVNDLDVHFAIACPPRPAGVTRWGKFTFTSGDGKTTYEYNTEMGADAIGPLIGSTPTPAIALATKKANLAKALPAVPAPSPSFQDTTCPDDVVKVLPRAERVGLFTVSWDDAARTLGVKGAGSLCKGVFADPTHALDKTPRLLYVLRASSCVPTAVDAAKQEFSGGAITGVTSIVDVSDGKVLCSARVTAEAAKTVHVYEKDDPGSQVSFKFAEKVGDAEAAAIRRVSRFIDDDPSMIDPETR